MSASDEESLKALSAALTSVLGDLAYMLVRTARRVCRPYPCDWGGIRCRRRARGPDGGHSQLVKTALYGRDANWGRIVAAVGRSGADFNPDDVVVTLCGVELFRKGQPTDLDFDALLEEPLKQRDLPIDIVLGSGSGSYTLLASDLGHEYVNVNADYRS
ncbi:MAG: bifunctional ornithine acetyltransferase/N-acetylglutamate synthase [Bilophila wadsworthia]